MDYDLIEEKIGYKFKNINLLKMALTHSSYAHDNGVESYEKLEFLGDSILEGIVSVYLFKNVDETEGNLSKYRAKIVSATSLAKVVKKIGLDKYLKIGKSLKNATDSILADIFESVIGAIFLDSGYRNSTKFVMDNLIVNKANLFDIIYENYDFKTTLQEVKNIV